MTGIASAATSVVNRPSPAGGTKTIRVEFGRHHAPQSLAPRSSRRQSGTLASLYPDRIDLGLGRALPAPTWPPRAHYAAIPVPAPKVFRRTSRNSGPISSFVWPGWPGKSRPSLAPRHARADLAARFQPVQRATRRASRTALCFRLPLCAHRSPSGAGNLLSTNSSHLRNSGNLTP